MPLDYQDNIQTNRISDSILNTELYAGSDAFRLISHKNTELTLLENEVFSEMTAALRQINPMKLSNYYFRAVLDSRDLFPVLELLDTCQKTDLAIKLMNYAEKNSVFEDYSGNFLQSMLHFYSAPEKVILLKYLLDGTLTFAKQDFIREIFHSAKDLKNLAYLVKHSQIESKTELRNRDIKEFIATAVIGTALCKFKLPDPPKKNASLAESNLKIGEIKIWLLEKLNFMEKFSEYKRTDTFREYKSGIRNILYVINNRKRSYCRKTKGNNPVVALRNFANEVLEMTDILRHSKISLTSHDPKMKKNGGDKFRDWGLSEIRDVKKAIDLIGKGRILSTPCLFEIQRYTDYDYCGRRTENGVIIISDFATDGSGFENIYPKISQFLAVTVHEMLHGIQWGRKTSSTYSFDNESGQILGPADSSSGFQEFTMLSDWRILRQKHTHDKGLHVFTLNGRKLRFNVPESADGDNRIYVFSAGDNKIFSCFAEARFGFQRNSDNTPEEDYAESCTDYLLAPREALKYEADKFLFFERLYRKYDSNITIQKELANSLEELLGNVLTIEDIFYDRAKILPILPSEEPQRN